MEWYQICSFFFANGIQFFLCLCLIAKLLDFLFVWQKAVLYSLVGAGIVAAFLIMDILNMFSLSQSQFYLLGIEMLTLFLTTRMFAWQKPRMCLFLIFFFEIGVALWEYLVSAWLGVLFQSEKFLVCTALEYMAAVWIVRLIMIGIAAFMMCTLMQRKFSITWRTGSADKLRFPSVIAVLGLFGVVSLSEQSVISLDQEQLSTWIILSVIFMFAILVFNLSRQYEMEKEILRLKEEQAGLLERDYQTLNKIYSTNAKLYHDLHNHVEVMYRYLTQGKTKEAMEYLEDLRAPIQEIVQTIWTGDEAIDYLINSKLSLAQQTHITLKINIEFPRGTTIHSADLTSILGNLLDNALEATKNVKDEQRFINLTIRRINQMLVIKIENGCEVMPIVDNGVLKSTKKDECMHGWGLKSVRAATEHYDGTVETSFANHIFCTVVTLFFDVLQI